MSQVSTSEASYQAKDGLWYPCYADMCEANKQFNQRHLEKLGLGASSSPFSRRQQQRKADAAESKRKLNGIAVAGTNNMITPELLQPTRRSLRARKVPPPLEPTTTLDPLAQVDEDGRPTKQARVHRVVPASQQQHQQHYHQLTEEHRQKLQNLNDWFDEMHQFLLHVPHGRGMKLSICSSDNARSVMRQVQRLVAGVGITYQHWPEGMVFLPNTPVTLNWDLEDLYQQAVDFENTHGRDKGNGWLLRHPIRKMGFFQQYKLEQFQEDEVEEFKAQVEESTSERNGEQGEKHSNEEQQG